MVSDICRLVSSCLQHQHQSVNIITVYPSVLLQMNQWSMRQLPSQVWAANNLLGVFLLPDKLSTICWLQIYSLTNQSIYVHNFLFGFLWTDHNFPHTKTFLTCILLVPTMYFFWIVTHHVPPNFLWSNKLLITVPIVYGILTCIYNSSDHVNG